MQSGGIGIALLEHLSRLGIGVSSFASVGDKYDVSSNDLLTWWEQDGRTRLAVLYVESFGSPRKFARTARRVGQQMPVLTVVGGRSAAGQRAAASQTAAAATPLVTQEALFAQAGHHRAPAAWANWSRRPRCWPASRCRPVTGSRSCPTPAARACWPPTRAATTGCGWPASPRPTRRRLRGLLPAGAAVAGPVDTTAAVTADAFRPAWRRWRPTTASTRCWR